MTIATGAPGVVTEYGFVPPTVAVAPGSVVAFVNVDLAEHVVSGSDWESGLLAPGTIYKVGVATTGTFTYADTTDALNKGSIVVPEGAGASRLFLPAIARQAWSAPGPAPGDAALVINSASNMWKNSEEGPAGEYLPAPLPAKYG